MKKIALSDGRWFDADEAKAFSAAYETNEYGEEVCVGTKNPYIWETLYLTHKGHFVLVVTCDGRYPDVDRVCEVDWVEAAKWLIQNGHQDKLHGLELQHEERKLEV